MKRRMPLFLAILLSTSGCIRLGPKTIRGDRFDYSGAISTSGKAQMLTNLVRVRYMDAPVFLEIAQVVATYTVEAAAGVNTPDWNGGSYFPVANVGARSSESPTITYNPVTGEKFTKSLLAPVSPIAVLEMIQAGWPLDAIFAIAVKGINGLNAASYTDFTKQEADPEFYQVVKLLRELQLTNVISIRLGVPDEKKSKDEEDVRSGTVIVFNRGQLDEANLAKSREVRRLLGLNQEVSQFQIAFGSLHASDKEIALLTRSILEIIGEAAIGVEVPAQDLKEGRALPAAETPSGADQVTLFRVKVHSSNSKPSISDTFVATHYHGHWFWIDDRDLSSKRGLTFLMLLSTLAEAGTTISPPVLTISKP